MMKKIIVALLLCVALMVGTAVADEIDLTKLSSHELLELSLQINNELHLRGESNEGYLYQGVYVVGEDIEEGRYLFKCERLIQNKRDFGEIYVDSPHERLQGCELRSDGEWSGRLREGAKLHLVYAECSFIKLD